MGSMIKGRLSLSKQDQFIKYFASVSTARTAAGLSGMNRKTSAFFLLLLREMIAYKLGSESEDMFGDNVKIAESYFCGHRIGECMRVSVGNINVFRLCKHDEKVYTKIISNASGATLFPISERKVTQDRIVCFDS